MNTSTPKPLARSREFLALDFGGRLAVRVLWRRGASRRWEDDELLSADDQVTLELEASGLFDGPGAVEVRAQMLRAMLRTGALVREPGALEMPIFTGDRPRDERSETPEARRKREQRDRDRKDPARIEERRRQREAREGSLPSGEPPSPASAARDTSRDTAPLSRPPVTPPDPADRRDEARDELRDPSRVPESLSVSENSSEHTETQTPERAREGEPVTGEGSVTGTVTPPVESERRAEPLPDLRLFPDTEEGCLALASAALEVLGRAGDKTFMPNASPIERVGFARALRDGGYTLDQLALCVAHWRAEGIVDVFFWDRGVQAGEPASLGVMLGSAKGHGGSYEARGLRTAVMRATTWDRRCREEKRRSEQEARQRALDVPHGVGVDRAAYSAQNGPQGAQAARGSPPATAAPPSTGSPHAPPVRAAQTRIEAGRAATSGLKGLRGSG